VKNAQPLRSLPIAALRVAAVVAGWLAGTVGCVEPAPPTPDPIPIDASLQRVLDERTSAISPSERVFDAPRARSTAELEPGTWALYRILDPSGEPSFRTYRVLRRTDFGYWIEVASYTYYGRTLFLLHVSFGERRSPSDIEVARLFQQVNGTRVREFPRELLGRMQRLYEPVLAVLACRGEEGSQEDVIVPAGTFRQAYKYRVESRYVGFEDETDVWYHEAAGVGGLVQTRSRVDGLRMELVEVGTNPRNEIPLPAPVPDSAPPGQPPQDQESDPAGPTSGGTDLGPGAFAW